MLSRARRGSGLRTLRVERLEERQMLSASVPTVVSGASSGTGISYYVDTAGNDAANGLTPATAWATLAKVDKASLMSGDKVLLKSGCHWHETLTVPSAGITIGRYGSGAKPIIDGADQVTAWTKYGNNLWQAKVSIEPYAVWFNGAPGIGGQNHNASEHVVTPVASINAVAAGGSKHWYWNSGVLTVYSVGQPVNFEVAQRATCVNASGKDHVTIQGLDLRYANWVDVLLKNDLGCTIQVCTIHDSHNQAILIYSDNASFASGGHTILNNTIYNTGISRAVGGNGCAIQTLNVPPTFTTTIGSLIEHNNIYGVFGDSHDHCIYDETYDPNGGDRISDNVFECLVGDGVKLDGTSPGTLVDYNVFRNCGNGIACVDGGSGKIYNNVFYNCGKYPGVSPYSAIWYQPTTNGKAYTGATLDIKNNIIYGACTAINFPDRSSTVGGLTSDHNLIFKCIWAACWGGVFEKSLADWQKASGQDSHTLATDPLFVDAVHYNFHLKPASPCIAAGAFVGQSADHDGVLVSKTPAIGAYE